MRPYANPYVAGTALGLVLLACFVLTGQGLGASGAFAEAASLTVAAAAPEKAHTAYFQTYLQGGPPWTSWIVLEVLGVVAGGFLSALVSRRLRWRMARGPSLKIMPRLATAAGGGVLMGIGAVLARGCTSGQALSGGAVLGVGSWAFMIAVFVAGYATAPLVRRVWS
jgi:uncharacterized membrane protein YedE/YeeE